MADRRRRRASTSVVRWSVSARWGGALLWRQRWTGTHNRNLILCGTVNRWSCRRRGVVCSDLLAEYTSRAEAFSTDCNISAAVFQTHQPTLNNRSEAWWWPVPRAESTEHPASVNGAQYGSVAVPHNRSWRLQWCGLSYSQSAPWSWKVMEFRKTIFQAWKVMKNSKGYGKSWKMMIMSWNFYYCTEQVCKSDTTSFIMSNYEPFYLFNNGTMSRWNCHY